MYEVSTQHKSMSGLIPHTLKEVRPTIEECNRVAASAGLQPPRVSLLVLTVQTACAQGDACEPVGGTRPPVNGPVFCRAVRLNCVAAAEEFMQIMRDEHVHVDMRPTGHQLTNGKWKWVTEPRG